MGYRSDVRIRTTKKGFEILEKEIQNKLKEKNLTEDYNLLKVAKITVTIEDGKDAVTIDWECIKWYQGYKDVDIVMSSLSTLAEENIDYQYMRIGEEIADIEEIWNVNNDSFEGFYCSRNFEG